MATTDEQIAEERLQIAMDLAEEAERAGRAADILSKAATEAENQGEADAAASISRSDLARQLSARQAKCIADLIALTQD